MHNQQKLKYTNNVDQGPIHLMLELASQLTSVPNKCSEKSASLLTCLYIVRWSSYLPVFLYLELSHSLWLWTIYLCL